ncbi:hypothetical protein M3Y98_00308500 [Aphelenchoides besseyi]|nr:hypothetical protein M3Y98_00308500 [Aphelenchoides besseyi]KAI6201297.1 hypothetical protein M3Y96_00826800 [Aphelenchoides besseyi]
MLMKWRFESIIYWLCACMLLPDNEIRHRRHALNDYVREFDSFNKVSEDVQEQKSPFAGLYAIGCFVIIFVLCVGQINDYIQNDDVIYKFDVDISYDEKPTMAFDLMIAMPCSSLNVFALSQGGGSNSAEGIVKEPSRFEMDDKEQKLWDRLKEAQQKQYQVGTRFKALSDMSFVSSYVEEGLRSIADDKVAEEVNEIQQRRDSAPSKPNQNRGDNTNVEDQSSACRVHGSMSILKAEGKLIVSPTNTINLQEFFGAEIGGHTATNFSHRIESFHFGPHIRGLVTPLGGADKISNNGHTMYKYFIKIVPTRIYNRFGGHTLTYQYSVTSMQRDMNESGFVSSGIAFTYEFTAYVVEIWPKHMYTPKIINGGFAGIVGVTCVFPLDLIKTRLQNQRPDAQGKLQYKGIIDCAKKTFAAGGTRFHQKFFSMYSGSGANLLLITPEKAIKLVANDFFRYQLSTPGQKALSVPRGMLAGGLAGFCQIIVTTPMELLKIQGQQASGKKVTATQLALSLLREKGVLGLYQGLGPTMARDVTFSLIYFPLFAKLDSLGPRKSDGSGDAVFYASFVAGIIAGAVGSFSVTPLLINNEPGVKPYKGIRDAFMKILEFEGPRALFKGALSRVLVTAPLFGIAQTVYYIGVAEYVLGIKKVQHV